jgi:uncharacterized protein
MQQILVGRTAEIDILNKALQSNEPEMVALIGRRRVGKTFLVRQALAGKIDFELTGEQNTSLRQQLQNFADRLTFHTKPLIPFQRPGNWHEAFAMLVTWLEADKKPQKRVLFLDELPWLATRRSDFLQALGYFWNSWASQNHIMLVICGSAASWMIQNIVRDRGGLYNRVTRRIHLQPFSLSETEAFLKHRNVRLDRYQLVQIYMALGGIPHYLKEVEGGKTAAQNIDHICFSPNGLLRDEFLQLYPALFEQAEVHMKMIRLLTRSRQGMTRAEIIEHGELANGGNTSKVIDELESSGFITGFYAFGKKKKEIRYRLTDEYSLFYLKFIEVNNELERGSWQSFSQNQSWKSWSGYAFENLALRHLPNIKKALGIAAVYTESSTFVLRGNDEQKGVQIDLLIDRNDHAINVCELKFYNEDVIVNQSMATTIRQKIAHFKAATQTKKQVFLTLITPFPLIPNEHSIGLVDVSLTMDAFFD